MLRFAGGREKKQSKRSLSLLQLAFGFNSLGTLAHFVPSSLVQTIRPSDIRAASHTIHHVDRTAQGP